MIYYVTNHIFQNIFPQKKVWMIWEWINDDWISILYNLRKSSWHSKASKPNTDWFRPKTQANNNVIHSNYTIFHFILLCVFICMIRMLKPSAASPSSGSRCLLPSQVTVWNAATPSKWARVIWPFTLALTARSCSDAGWRSCRGPAGARSCSPTVPSAKPSRRKQRSRRSREKAHDWLKKTTSFCTHKNYKCDQDTKNTHTHTHRPSL